MAKKKLKSRVPSPEDVWKDAVSLLQHAFWYERDATLLTRVDGLDVLLSEIHNSVNEFYKTRAKITSSSLRADQLSRLAKVYERKRAGEFTNDAEYRWALYCDVGGFHGEGDSPNDIQLIPKYLLKSGQKIREERGPVQAATLSLAQWLGKGPRQLQKDRAGKKRGKLAYRLADFTRGFIMPDVNFFNAILIRIMKCDKHLANKISKQITKKN